MSIITIIFFFICTYGLGFTITSFVKNSENFLERNIMRIGIGICAFIVVGLFLNLFHIPLDWRIFLGLSLIYPVFCLLKQLYKNKGIQTSQTSDLASKLKIKITKTNICTLLALLLFFLVLFMYVKGAFTYPYLEDDDSWSHALGIKYVSMEKTVYDNPNRAFQYFDPYPPGYDLLMGVLLQTANSVMWTLKFFNALLVSLSIIFFYFFAKEFMGDKNKALFSTFCLAAVPAFLSHFIWAISLAVPLYFVAFYCLEKIKGDRKWFMVAIVTMASILVLTPTHSPYFGFLFILYFIAKTILQKRFLIFEFLSGFFSVLLSFILWWAPMIFKYGLKGVFEGLGLGGGEFTLKIIGTGDRPYTLADFFIAQPQNMINNPIGIGIFLSLLAIVSLIAIAIKNKNLLKKENHWIIVSFVWFLFTLYAVNAARFPIRFSPFRTWMLFAIPLCILASEGLWLLFSVSKKFNVPKVIILAIVVVGILLTSGYQKYTVNTAYWPPGAFWASMEELQGYGWLKTLPYDTNVFSFINDGAIIGFDKFTCSWCPEVFEFKKIGFNQSAEYINSWLKQNRYHYIVLGGQEVNVLGYNQTLNKMQELGESDMFRIAYQNQGVVFFEVV